MSSKFDDFLQEQLQDSEIRKEYEALQPKHTLIQTEINAGQKFGIPPKSSTHKRLYPSEYFGCFYAACPVIKTGDSGILETAIPKIQNR